MTDPQHPFPANRSDADDAEEHTCPKCGAQPGSPCRSRGGAVASAYHTRRFTMVPRLKKALGCPSRPTAARAGRGLPPHLVEAFADVNVPAKRRVGPRQDALPVG
jgi:hypothetical protein